MEAGVYLAVGSDRRVMARITFGHRNVIERCFRALKEQTRLFYNSLSSMGLDNLQSFMDVFVLSHNHLRRQHGLGRILVKLTLSKRHHSGGLCQVKELS